MNTTQQIFKQNHKQKRKNEENKRFDTSKESKRMTKSS